MIVSDALEENSKDLIADKVEKLTADKLFVKREAIHEAGKMKGKDSKKINYVEIKEILNLIAN